MVQYSLVREVKESIYTSVQKVFAIVKSQQFKNRRKQIVWWYVFLVVGCAWLACSAFAIWAFYRDLTEVSFSISRREAFVAFGFIVFSLPMVLVIGGFLLHERIEENIKLQEWLDKPLFPEKRTVADVPTNQ